jgi:hypothetical protein
MFSRRNFEEKRHLPNETKTLFFPFNSTGIFRLFSYLSVSELVDQIDMRSSEGNDWVALLPVCTINCMIFDPKEYIQFQYSQFEMIGYEIVTKCNNCSVFASLDGLNWVSIHKVTDNFNFNSQTFAAEVFGTFSYLRIQNNDDYKRNLSRFKLYGKIMLNDNSINIKQFATRSKPILNPQSIYSFTLDQDWGLIGLFGLFLLKLLFTILFYFVIIRKQIHLF